MQNAVLSKTARKQIHRAAFGMASDQRFWILRVMAFVATKLLNWLFGSDLYIDEAAVKHVQKLQKDHTLIYAPTHKSHLDSIIMGYVTFAYGLEPPHIVAGDNLMLPLVSYMMRGSGAFFIRRTNKNGADRELYKKTLAGFIEALMCHGKHIEFFIEGGRSRDGCILSPRLGILAHIVDALIDADLPKGNVAVVPVHISYDHPFEEDSMMNELMGQPKQKETLWGFLMALFKLFCRCWMQPLRFLGVGGRCGCATVAFGSPLHLKKFFRSMSRGMKLTSTASQRAMYVGNSVRKNDLLAAAFPMGSDERYNAVSNLGTAIHAQLRRIHVIPASSILYCTIFVQYVLYSERGRHLKMDDVMRHVAKLQRLLRQAGAQFMSLDTDTKKTTAMRIRGFVSRLDKWVELSDTQGKDEFSIRPIIASSVVFYIRSNHLMVKLAPRCLVACAVVACIHGFETEPIGRSDRSQCAPRQSDFVRAPCADRSSIIAAALWLREILSPELDGILGEESFWLQANIEHCLDGLLDDGVLMLCIPPQTKPNHKRASSVSSSAASGTQGSHRRSVDRVVDKLISGVMEDMEVRGRASMQFESDLKKYKDLPGQSYLTQRKYKLSKVLPSVQQEPESLADTDANPDPGNDKSGRSCIAFAGDLKLGGDFYSFMYSPLISTYAILFEELSRLFRKKGHFSENELVRELMTTLSDAWQAIPVDFCRRPIPCLTIVQRFVHALSHNHIPKEENSFTPYPMLSLNAVQGMQGSRPPRPSLGDSSLRRASDREASSSLNSVSSLPDVSNSESLLHIRREFRDGGLTEYHSKLRLFIMSCKDNVC